MAVAPILAWGHGGAQTTIEFPSKDGLMITADVYRVDKTAPFIVLCHKANSSRGEYRETAKKLNELGFNCLALDARSGKEMNGVENQTAKRAREKGLPTDYLDAERDIIAAVDYTFELGGGEPVILFGSSYSSSLDLKIGAENPKVKAIIAFSPGEYFGKKLSLKRSIDGLDKPTFVTSSRSEAPQVTELLEGLPSSKLVHFIPTGEGIHGSAALWSTQPNHEEYWKALKAFLETVD